MKKENSHKALEHLSVKSNVAMFFISFALVIVLKWNSSATYTLFVDAILILASAYSFTVGLCGSIKRMIIIVMKEENLDL